MKKMFSLIAVLLLLSFVLVGCGSKEVEVVDVEEQKSNEAITSGERETTDKLELTQEQKDAAIDKLGGLSKVYVYPSSLGKNKLSYGESYVFAVGIWNIENRETDFEVEFSFKEAEGEYMMITTEEDKMEEWISRNKVTKVTLEPDEKTVVPFIVTVKDVRDQIKAEEGHYVFNVDVSKVNEKGFHNDYVKKEVTIPVE